MQPIMRGLVSHINPLAALQGNVICVTEVHGGIQIIIMLNVLLYLCDQNQTGKSSIYIPLHIMGHIYHVLLLDYTS